MSVWDDIFAEGTGARLLGASSSQAPAVCDRQVLLRGPPGLVAWAGTVAGTATRNFTSRLVLSAFAPTAVPSGVTSPTDLLLRVSAIALLSHLPLFPPPHSRAGRCARVQRKGVTGVLPIEMQQGARQDLKPGGEPAGLLKILVGMRQGDYILFDKRAPRRETLWSLWRQREFREYALDGAPGAPYS